MPAIQKGEPGWVPQTEVPPPEPRRKRHWVRWAAAGTGVFVAGVAVAAGLAGSGQETQAPVAVVTPPAVTAPAAPVTPARPSAPSTADRFLAWYEGAGYVNMTAVQSDVSTVASDAAAQDVAALEADGPVLAADARAAAGTPCPVGTGDYVAAMNQYAQAGDALGRGDITDATGHLQNGLPHLDKTAAAIRAFDPSAEL